MGLKQEKIATLHDFSVDKEDLIKAVRDAVVERPVSIVMPMLYQEVNNKTLFSIKKGLDRCTYLKEIIIPLAARDNKEFTQVKRFFSDLSKIEYEGKTYFIVPQSGILMIIREEIQFETE